MMRAMTHVPAADPAPPTLVVFDIGGVLIRHHRAWAPACRAVGLPVPENVDEPSFLAARRRLHHLFGIGEIDEDAFYAGMASADTQRLYTPADIRRLHEGWLLDEYAGVASLLASLRRAARARTATLSNTNAGHWRQMNALPDSRSRYASLTHIEHLHASHLLRAAKPDALIYERFEAAMNAKPHEILFFDDLKENIAAASSRGWRTVLVDHTQETEPQIRAALIAHRLLD